MNKTWYNRIKGFYEKSLWTLEMVAEGVRCNKITAEEFKEITNQDYQA